MEKLNDSPNPTLFLQSKTNSCTTPTKHSFMICSKSSSRPKLSSIFSTKIDNQEYFLLKGYGKQNALMLTGPLPGAFSAASSISKQLKSSSKFNLTKKSLYSERKADQNQQMVNKYKRQLNVKSVHELADKLLTTTKSVTVSHVHV